MTAGAVWIAGVAFTLLVRRALVEFMAKWLNLYPRTVKLWFWNLCVTNTPILQCIILLMTWLVHRRLYPERTKPFIFGFVFVFVLAQKLPVCKNFQIVFLNLIQANWLFKKKNTSINHLNMSGLRRKNLMIWKKISATSESYNSKSLKK